MTEKKDLMIPPQGGMIKDFLMRVKLIFRLIGDRRVSFWLKLIPFAGVLYFVIPLDLIVDLVPPIGQLDDITLLWLTNYVFIELCPPEIVGEHVKSLTGSYNTSDNNDVIDAESVDIEDNKK